jgi:hypothetical protein
MSPSCRNKQDNFFYICGELTMKAQRKPLWGKLTSFILAVRLAISISFGLQKFAAVHVPGH